jgi:hypothetical protein
MNQGVLVDLDNGVLNISYYSKTRTIDLYDWLSDYDADNSNVIGRANYHHTLGVF